MGLRESIPRQVDKSGVPKEEKGVTGALEAETGLWNFQRGGKDKYLFSFLYIP